MLPWVYGFSWDAGNVIFLGLFFLVAVVIATTVILAALRASRDVHQQKAEAIRWQEDFHELPEPCRACRHQLTGEIARRICPNAFDCRICTVHPKFLERNAPFTIPGTLHGLAVPGDRLYHRGHTWVRQEPDGTVCIGLDSLGERIVGTPDAMELPGAGSQLSVNGTGWTVKKGNVAVRILSPIDGTVLETNCKGEGWVLRVKPQSKQPPFTHLLTPKEALAWMATEAERFKALVQEHAPVPTLADGGELTGDLPAHYPNVEWDAIWGTMFMEP